MGDETNASGTLYVCATPIGNLEDVTLRVLRVLREADFVAAEDTRRTVKLLNHYEIKTPLVSYREHNKRHMGDSVAERILNGENCALTSDAGTPGISDPGADLIKLCVEKGIKIDVCPGASAVLPALLLSGFDAGRFCFEGFLPESGKERAERLEALRDEPRAAVIYEAPHRIAKTLGELAEHLGQSRRASVSRELTKVFEETLRGTLGELTEAFSGGEPKGEYVIVVEGRGIHALKAEGRAEWLKAPVTEHFRLYSENGMSKMDAIKAVAKDRGVPKSKIYAMLLEAGDL